MSPIGAHHVERSIPISTSVKSQNIFVIQKRNSQTFEEKTDQTDTVKTMGPAQDGPHGIDLPQILDVLIIALCRIET